VEPRWVTVQEVGLGGVLPEDRRPVRIAVISDLHAEGDREPWSGLAEQVNSTDPDLILMLGDTLNRSRALPVLRRILRRMRASHGKYAVWGNWETWYWSRLPLLEGTGFSWLHRRRVTKRIHGQTVHLVGLPFGNKTKGARAERLLARAPRGWRIFLYHTPDLVMEVPSADLYLAGHTHGGQVAIPLYGALVTLSRFGKRFERGLYRVEQTHLYVNPGIGVEPAVPVRLGVRPEVTLITLGSPPRRR
jgi:predicted MPP superfamily phosphohydrolase